MESETRELTYLAMSLIILAMVIGFISYGLSLSRKVAASRNDEIYTNEKIEQYREFNAYDHKTLFGDDIVELIRMEYDSGVCIFVDYRKNMVNSAIVQSGTRCTRCMGKSYDHRYFSLESYIAHNGDASNNYFKLNQNSTGSGDDLRSWFPTGTRYRTYLVYNNEDPATYYLNILSVYNSKKTSNKTIENMEKWLDAGVKAADPTYEVTGVIVINLDHLKNI